MSEQQKTDTQTSAIFNSPKESPEKAGVSKTTPTVHGSLPQLDSLFRKLNQLSPNTARSHSEAKDLVAICFGVEPGSIPNSVQEAKEGSKGYKLARLVDAFASGAASPAILERATRSLKSVESHLDTALNLIQKCPGLQLDLAATIIASSKPRGISAQKIGETINNISTIREQPISELSPTDRRTVVDDAVELANLRKDLRPEVGDEITYKLLAQLLYEIGDTAGVEEVLDAIESVPLTGNELSFENGPRPGVFRDRARLLLKEIRRQESLDFDPCDYLASTLNKLAGGTHRYSDNHNRSWELEDIDRIEESLRHGGDEGDDADPEDYRKAPKWRGHRI